MSYLFISLQKYIPRFLTYEYVNRVQIKSVPHIRRQTVRSSPVNCCWPSSTQSFLISSPVGTHDLIYDLPKTVYVFGNGASFSTRGLRSHYYWLLSFYCGVIADSHSLIHSVTGNPKPEVHVQNIYKFISYRVGNTLRHPYKAQPVNAV
jgi:hypothetical protein